MYKPKYFELYEMLPYSFYAQRHSDGDRLWQWLFDWRMPWTADRLRELYGPATINDYYWGGRNHYSGWRPWDCKTGAEWSQHKFGRAGDQKFKYVTAEEVREAIKNEDRSEFQYITCIEEDTSWLHFDCRNFLKSKYGLLIIKP